MHVPFLFFFFSFQSLDSDLSDGPISVHEFLEVKNALSASEAKIQELMKANSNLSEELKLMQKKVPEIPQWVLNSSSTRAKTDLACLQENDSKYQFWANPSS